MSRVGQWKFTDEGACQCIAEGDGFVMVRNRGRMPWCYWARIWDEKWDYTCPEGFELSPTPPVEHEKEDVK